jgi:hypothetical protein
MKNTLPPDLRDPQKVAAGHASAEKRWGPPRIVRLDDMTGPQRRVVLALIDAARALSVPAGQG